MCQKAGIQAGQLHRTTVKKTDATCQINVVSATPAACVDEANWSDSDQSQDAMKYKRDFSNRTTTFISKMFAQKVLEKFWNRETLFILILESNY